MVLFPARCLSEPDVSDQAPVDNGYADRANSWEHDQGYSRTHKTDQQPSALEIPRAPVICAQNPSRPTEVNRPVKPDRLTALLKKMAEGTGISDRVTTHAIRRGAIHDVVHLPSSTLNLTDRAVGAAVADHSRRALQSGVTDDYVGSLQVGFCRQRHSLRGQKKGSINHCIVCYLKAREWSRS